MTDQTLPEKQAPEDTSPGTENKAPESQPGDLIASAFGRAVELGGLATRMGAALIGTKLRLPFQDELAKSELLKSIYIREAERLVDRLSNLKGAAMKFGQMLSVMESGMSGALPPEVSAILARLQKDARPLAYDTAILPVLQAELGQARLDELAWIDTEALACASIGQVHRARLHSGQEIVLKVQYPDMPRIVRSDIKNLKVLVMPFTALFGIRNMDAIWAELEARLNEELDYRQEAEHLREMSAIWAEHDRVIIPEVIAEYSSERVLAMSYEPGLSGEELDAEADQDLRDQWGQTLAQTLLECMFVHRFIHADPNFGNYAFRADGRIILYDFGCVKRVPETVASAYGRSARALLDEQLDDVPAILHGAGIGMKNGSPLGLPFVRDHAVVLGAPFRAEAPYFRFGEHPELSEEVWRLAQSYWYESLAIEFPPDILMIHRTLGGTMANLSRLNAAWDWRGLLAASLDRAGY